MSTALQNTYHSVYSLKPWTTVSFTAFEQKINKTLFNFLKALI